LPPEPDSGSSYFEGRDLDQTSGHPYPKAAKHLQAHRSPQTWVKAAKVEVHPEAGRPELVAWIHVGLPLAAVPAALGDIVGHMGCDTG
jgi:hypothetical protein